MKRWNKKVGMTAAVVCAGLQIGCTTVRETDSTEKKSVVTTIPEGQPRLVRFRDEGWTEAGMQEVSDVTRKQLFSFHFNRKDVHSIRLEAEGSLVGGKAMLKMLETCPASASPEEVEISGNFTAFTEQRHKHHSVGMISFEYVPEGVTSGNLTIKVCYRKD